MQLTSSILALAAAFCALSCSTSASPASFEGVAHLPRRDQAPVYQHCRKANTVALTFDDGPWKWERSIVDQLDNANAKGEQSGAVQLSPVRDSTGEYALTFRAASLTARAGSFFVNGNNYGESSAAICPSNRSRRS